MYSFLVKDSMVRFYFVGESKLLVFLNERVKL